MDNQPVPVSPIRPHSRRPTVKSNYRLRHSSMGRDLNGTCGCKHATFVDFTAPSAADPVDLSRDGLLGDDTVRHRPRLLPRLELDRIRKEWQALGLVGTVER